MIPHHLRRNQLMVGCCGVRVMFIQEKRWSNREYTNKTQIYEFVYYL